MKEESVRLVVFGIVLVLLASGIGTASAFSNSGGGDWKYYKEITVKENSGKSLTDFQVLVELNAANFPANAKSDGSDLRFEDGSGKELNYWIEEWNYGTKNARVWVKVSSIPANGKAKLKMYYGNPKATSASNGISTFIRWDDFDAGYSGGDSLKPERGWSTLGVVNIQQDPNDPSNLVVRSSDPGDGKSIMVLDLGTIYEDIRAIYRTRVDNHVNVDYDAGEGDLDWSSGRRVHQRWDVNKNIVSWSNPTAWGPYFQQYSPEQFSYLDATWYTVEFIVYKHGGTWYHKFIKDGKTGTGYFRVDPTNGISLLDFCSVDYTSPTNAYLDNIWVTKYTSPEPTLTISAEIPIERKPKFEISGPYIIPKFLSPNRIVDNALLGTYIDNEIKLGISNDEDVKKVICKFKSPAGFIAVQDLELSKTGGLVKSDGYEYYNYEGEIKARSLKPLIGWLISFFGTGFSSHADAHEALIDFTPPVTLEKIIITDVYGTEHEFEVNEPLVSIDDQIFNPQPINPAFLDYKYVATYSSVHILITDEEGNKIGWEEDSEFKEIENAVYSGADIHPEFIILFQPKLAYSLNVSGVKSGDFTLHIVSADATAKTVSKFEKVPATANTKAFIQITEKAQEMSVDYDGDGKIDEEKEPVSEVIEVIPEIPTPSPSPTPTPSPPGFEVIFAIAGLLAVAFLLRRRR